MEEPKRRPGRPKGSKNKRRDSYADASLPKPKAVQEPSAAGPGYLGPSGGKKGPKGSREPEQLTRSDEGVSFIRQNGHKPEEMVVEIPHLSKALPPQQVPPMLVEPGNKPRLKGNKMGRRPKFAVIGISADVYDTADPLYANALENARKYRKARAKELTEYHGAVSAGVGAFLANSALAIAASRYLYEKVAQTGDLALLRQAQQLSDSARQHELAAWELCAREAIVRRKLLQANAGAPWLTAEAPKKPGPKPKATFTPLPPMGSPLDGWIQAEVLSGPRVPQAEIVGGKNGGQGRARGGEASEGSGDLSGAGDEETEAEDGD